MLINKRICDICGTDMDFICGYTLENQNRHRGFFYKTDYRTSLDICEECATKLLNVGENIINES